MISFYNDFLTYVSIFNVLMWLRWAICTLFHWNFCSLSFRGFCICCHGHVLQLYIHCLKLNMISATRWAPSSKTIFKSKPPVRSKRLTLSRIVCRIFDEWYRGYIKNFTSNLNWSLQITHNPHGLTRRLETECFGGVDEQQMSWFWVIPSISALLC